ncbi:Dedicator of cytokinesis protein 9 [Fasciola gigantica]|uniref:Dedicator of cytokinesis protein 9 n=1 Tax=Fasciola gigantica TaxID=46835 RepID=A0A504Z4P8_FASGI|nr:Dedicator of cytokinesis protein 9 [Fasciola gigantica]
MIEVKVVFRLCSARICSSHKHTHRTLFSPPETVSSVHPIGDNWLKLDRVEQAGLVKDTSGSFSSELFIYFDNSIGGPTTRQTWLDRIQLLARNRVTPSTPTSFHVGPSETQPGRCAAAVSGGNSVSLDGGVTHSSTITSAIQFCVDSTSARNSLQRYAQETEFFISHQRQKGRLKLITVFPEVRIVYHKSQMAGQDRARIKSSIASYPSTDSMERVPNAACAVTDLRLTRGFNSASGSTSPSSASVLIPVPESNSAPVLPFPDRTVHLCSHRFLVTCLRLKSRLQCVLDCTTSSSGALDNAIFSVPSNAVNLEHIYLVVRVDKVLNGSISSAVEKYTKGALVSGPTTTTPGINAVDNKAACLLSRSMAVYCRHLGRYRMPFAWGARSLCSTSHRLPLFKMDSGRITEAAFMQQIQSLARLMDTTAVSPRNWPSNSPERVGTIGTETNARGALPLDVVERTLKIQTVPILLDVAVSELTDRSTDPGVQEVSVLVTPSLCPTKTGQLVGDKYYFIPPTHPTLTPNELVREVEHFFDIRSIPVVGVGTDSVMYTSAGEPELAILAGHSGSLSRSPNIGTVGAGSRNNRDSMISCSSAGSLPIGLDPATWNSTASAANSIASTRTNSLERSNPRAPTNPTDLSTNHRFPTSFGTDMVPFTSFHNTLYVSPKSLNLAVKHNFSRARNLSCFIELRCNDSLDSTAAIKVS